MNINGKIAIKGGIKAYTAPPPPNPGTLWSLSANELAYSPNEGQTWINVGSPKEGDVLSGLWATNAGKAYVGIRGKGLYKYTSVNGWELEYEDTNMDTGSSSLKTHVWCAADDSVVAVGWHECEHDDEFHIAVRDDDVWAISSSGPGSRSYLYDLHGFGSGGDLLVATFSWYSSSTGTSRTECRYRIGTAGWSTSFGFSGDEETPLKIGLSKGRGYIDGSSIVWLRGFAHDSDNNEAEIFTWDSNTGGDPVLAWSGHFDYRNIKGVWQEPIVNPSEMWFTCTHYYVGTTTCWLFRGMTSEGLTEFENYTGSSAIIAVRHNASTTKVFVASGSGGALYVYNYKTNEWITLTDCTVANCTNLCWVGNS